MTEDARAADPDAVGRLRQRARYAAEDGLRQLNVGRYAIARATLADAVELLDRAAAIEDEEDRP